MQLDTRTMAEGAVRLLWVAIVMIAIYGLISFWLSVTD